ncbi:MAG: DNA-deoxyinosine glycosylase [Eggerthellaceae bacterium]|nr:DNA-deoxyinosine glycosylase [Eggerthellaceae bacterium]
MASKYRHIAHGFDPVFDEASRVLVLGSFPSALSRANEFYYGNPQNRFWRVLAACVKRPVPETIPKKRDMLLSCGIALWDVIEECDIKGSSDASIKNVTPARIERMLDAARIEAVVCNGGTAGRLYRKYLQYRTGIEAVVLPSTSPANASWSEERLVERWGEVLRPLLEAGKSAEGDGENGKDGTLGDAHGEGEGASGGTPSKGARTHAARKSAAPPASTYGTHRSMQGNKSKDTKPEMLVRKRLREAGLGGYRLQWKAPGKPDIAWPGKKTCIEVRGCFWHRCPHCCPPPPKRNVEYWQAKFDRNVQRDAINLKALQSCGWNVHVIWECQLKKDVVEATFAELLPALSAELGKPLRL